MVYKQHRPICAHSRLSAVKSPLFAWAGGACASPATCAVPRMAPLPSSSCALRKTEKNMVPIAP